MQQADVGVLLAINGLAGTWALLDEVVQYVSWQNLLKGIPVMVLWWGLWWWSSPDQVRMRAGLLSTLACAVVAIFVGRGLNLMLPFRPRPLHDPGVDTILPIGATERTLDGWSSMPSDHAVLFFALAAGMFAVHRAIGYGLFAHAMLVVSLPRVFMAYHYPTDIIVGALLGCTITVLIWPRVFAAIQGSRVFAFERSHSHIVYPFLFLLTWQAGTMFAASRSVVSAAWQTVRLVMS